MKEIDFFKLQAKNFLKDYNNRIEREDGTYWHESPRFFKDIEDIIMCFDINEYKPFSLMNAQHIIALLAGFNKWSDLIHSNSDGLELGKLLFEHRNDYIDGFNLWDDWDNYLLTNGLLNETNKFKLELFKMLYLSDKN